MDSDTDSEFELPPGWEKRVSDGKDIYFDHISQSTSHTLSPLFNLQSGKYRGEMKDIVHRNSCGPSDLLSRSKKFVQKFDSFSTGEQVVEGSDLFLKRALVIGGCSGIGLEIVYHLVSKSCTIIIGCPNVQNCSENLKAKLGDEQFLEFCIVYHLDLTNFKSVIDFCHLILKKTDGFNMIILSAGIMCPPYTLTEHGFESTFQVNVLSQFYIQEHVLKKIMNLNCECRVIWLACESHRAIKSFDILQFNPSAEEYSGFHSYSLSNLCKIIIVKQSKKKWDLCGCNSKLLFFACHPGNVVSQTKITRYNSILKIMFWIFSPFTKSLSQAAATPLMCCVSNSIKKFSGCYFNNGCICEPSDLVYDENIGMKTWAYLENKIKDIFN